jgi:hypothetical protein
MRSVKAGFKQKAEDITLFLSESNRKSMALVHLHGQLCEELSPLR